MAHERGTLTGKLLPKDYLKGSLTSRVVLQGSIQPRSVLVGSISSRVQLVGRVIIPRVKVEIEDTPDTPVTPPIDPPVVEPPVEPPVEYIDTYVLVLKDGTQIRTEIAEVVEL